MTHAEPRRRGGDWHDRPASLLLAERNALILSLSKDARCRSHA
jgi:hypothetical protein